MSQTATADCPAALDFDKRPLAGEDPVNLCEAYRGKVVLVVNTASKCAFTGQYEGLEDLYATYRDQGLVVLGFPSNDFGNQEPGTEEQIKDFCRLTYSVQFPMFEKTRVKKGMADPLFEVLARQSGGTYPKWNFYKYLIGRDGTVVHAYSSMTSPKSAKLVKAVETELAKQPAS